MTAVVFHKFYACLLLFPELEVPVDAASNYKICWGCLQQRNQHKTSVVGLLKTCQAVVVHVLALPNLLLLIHVQSDADNTACSLSLAVDRLSTQ